MMFFFEKIEKVDKHLRNQIKDIFDKFLYKVLQSLNLLNEKHK